jgi:diguanylate cyclase (GGDEF)-like protein/PAS domain S-box-containing protein
MTVAERARSGAPPNDGPAAEDAAVARRYAQILDSAAEAFIEMGADGRIRAWNAQAETMFGWTREQAVGELVSELIVPASCREAHNSGVARVIATGKARVRGRTMELPGLHRDGHEFPLELTHWWIDEGGTFSFYAFARDITARKQAEATLEYDAHHDSLTGLANRSHLIARLGQALDATADGGAPPTVFFVDLDGFKPVNDGFGHDVGDQVLVTIGERLHRSTRPGDTVGRLAGDEFVLVAACGDDEVSNLARRLREVLDEPIRVGEDLLHLSASVGYATARPDSSAESLLAEADAAMYQAKRAGRGQQAEFDVALRRRVAGRLRLESDLARAVDDGTLELYYQPVLRVADQSVAGVEALLRWNHPARGLLPPGEFVDLAEESGLIVPIGAWVLQAACAQAKQWEQMFGAKDWSLQLAVNVSGRQLAQADLADRVSETIAAAQLSRTQMELCLEITESLLMQDPDSSAATLAELRALGVRVAIDDFGTGYSSLSYLAQFPVDTVKIDRSFIGRLPGHATDEAIVEAVVHLGDRLGLAVVAEGVETAEQLAALRRMRCGLAQGYLFARPQPAAAVTRWLADRQADSALPRPRADVPEVRRVQTAGAVAVG